MSDDIDGLPNIDIDKEMELKLRLTKERWKLLSSTTRRKLVALVERAHDKNPKLPGNVLFIRYFVRFEQKFTADDNFGNALRQLGGRSSGAAQEIAADAVAADAKRRGEL